MPAKPQWLLRLPEIIEEFSALDAPVVDRAVFERVFHVRRRRAIDLLNRFGGYQSGRTFLVDRNRLLATLAQIRASPDFKWEAARKQRLAESLEKVRRYQAAARVSIPVEPEVLSWKLPDCPDGVRLEPGTLKVEFDKPADLLEKLFALAQAIANDFERFEAISAKAD